MDVKKILRARLTAVREALPAGEVEARSARIRERLLAIPEVAAARSVFTYASHGNEVDTRRLIEDLLEAGKTVLVPLITGEGIMEPHRIRALADLKPGKFGIHAPGAPSPFDGPPDVTVCPGVAFSPRGDRLGRGKGYYDRFLARHPTTFAAGLAFECQVVDAVPSTPEDRRVDIIVTEDRAIRPAGS